jgi:uncharacterized Ntn-hydrolase superfamily protein
LLVVAAGQGYGGTSDVVVDLRVDEHPDPCTEIVRLLDIHEMLFGKPDQDKLIRLEGALADEVRSLLRSDVTDLDAALAGWAGVENLEERMVPGMIDPVVLAHLRRSAT